MGEGRQHRRIVSSRNEQQCLRYVVVGGATGRIHGVAVVFSGNELR